MNTNRNTFGGSRLYTRGNAHLGRNYSLAKLAIVGLVGLMVLVLSSTQAKANNVLLIIADDFGVDSHGLYGIGSSTAPTPTIDELALDGVQFLRAWSNPICSPTRATLLTGRYSFRTGVGFPVGGEPSHQIRLNEFTLPDALSQLGYRSAAIGKWHLSGDSNGEGLNPNFMGFDHYSGSLAGFIPDYYNWTKTVNGVNSTVTNYATTENVDDALAWISGQGSSPWFLWLAFNAGHSPFHKPPNELHSYDSLSGTQQDINNDPVPYYQAMIEAMDTEIGRLLSSIDLASTDIIFIGDNGTPSQVAVPPADSSRVKATLYQGGVWVPWIVSGPSVIGLPRTNSALVNTTDIFATIIELAGGVVDNVVPASVTHDSISILPLLEDPALGVLRNHVVAERFRVTTVARDGKTIRNDEFKLIRFDSGSEEFYDLFADETELLDLLGETLTATEQANYDSLTAELDNLLLNLSDEISIISPGDGDTVFGPVDIDIFARDGDLAAPTPTVEWRVATSAFQAATPDANNIYFGTWDSDLVTDGPHQLAAKMTDTGGQVSETAIQILVNNDPPEVNFVSPADGDTVRGNVTLSAGLINDDGTAVSVTFYDGTAEIGTDSNPGDGISVNWNTKRVDLGEHVLTVKATDNLGQVSIPGSSITVDVSSSKGGGGPGGGGGGPGNGGGGPGGGGGDKCFKNKEPLCP